ncbi:putative baseplate assembly protein [Calidithermus terrae]|uniref:Putative baseplate assembly protein n=1 Tax=Calidithermus terrae TaxID=1408545 RepID=A0A399EF66_9DEIN|nr:putative baseplate assembly protein [Calidithermus terrae]RIH82436.1 putative baseplate assembly protein [Calidithermus terrae]
MKLDPCGCCEGTQTLTPSPVHNPPGLSALAYRVGTHARFKASMLARLGQHAPLRALTTRQDDDPTLALLDAWAAVLDVLSFYQERIAQEGYLRSATERLSVLELARAIGYELRPGVAASTYLAFELETAPGAPALVPIPAGTRVQSLPGPGEQAQTYETVEAITARPHWNALRPRQSELRHPAFGDRHLYLQGTATQLKPGDPILIVGDERLTGTDTERWEFRRLGEVIPQPEQGRTLLRWLEPLGSRVPRVSPPGKGPRVFALRLRAALFGHNAPEWAALPVALRIGERNPQDNSFVAGAFASKQSQWADAKFAAGTTVLHLDAVYEPVKAGSWVVLAQPDDPPYVELYAVRKVGEESLSRYNVSGKSTRLEVSGEHVEKFSPRGASVFAQSEELPLAEHPLDLELWGKELELDSLAPDLLKNQVLVVSGKRLRVGLREERKGGLEGAGGSAGRGILPEDSLLVLAPPEPLGDGRELWSLRDAWGFEGTLTLRREALRPLPALPQDEEVSEAVRLAGFPDLADPQHSRLELQAPLAYCYDRTTVRLQANVALATHGEGKEEVLGSGDATRPFQAFSLKQSPLTHVAASTPSGAVSTLELRVDGVLWGEVPSLYGRGPREEVFTRRTGDDGRVTLRFGDGVSGARLPSGSENVRAKYRVGIGLAGRVRARQLSLLLTRPLGVRGVSNPLAPSGAQDPESRDDARRNAPFTVMTLERVVSLQDYEDFARTFAGVGKAKATGLPMGERPLVHLTIAGAAGAPVEPGSELFERLRGAIRAYGDPYQPFRMQSYEALPFALSAEVRTDPRYEREAVLEEVEQALLEAFAFERRAFAQRLSAGEVIALIQGAHGVVAVDLDALHLAGQSPRLEPHLPALPARWDDPLRPTRLFPAQLLTLEPKHIAFTEMTP